MQQQVASSRITVILALWLSLVWGVIACYILAPSNAIINIPRVHWSSGNFFDDAVFVTSVNHYYEDEGIKNWGLENRGGMLTSGKFGVNCSNKPTAVISLVNRDGNDTLVPSLNSPCIYLHSPPLHLWISSTILSLFDGNWRLLKVFLALLATISLIPLFVFLKRLTSEKAALFTIMTYSTAFAFWGWSTALYNQSYQFLIFYSLLALPLERRSWVNILFATLSFALAMTTYELVLALFFIFGLRRRFHQLKWIVLGLAAGFTLMTALKAMALGSLSMAFQDYFNTALNLYPIAGDLKHWLLGIFPIMARTIFAQWPAIGIVLPLFFIITLKEKSAVRERAQKYFVLSLSAMLVKLVVLPGFSFYHTHVLHRLFHLPLLIALCFTLYSISRYYKKREMVALISLFILMTIPNYGMLSNWIRTFNWIWRSPVANELTYNFSDFSEEVLYNKSGGTIHKSLRLRYNTEKFSLVDGVFDREISPPIVLGPQAIYHFDWIYPKVFTLNRVRLIVDAKDVLLIQNNCSIANWFEQLQEVSFSVAEVKVSPQKSAIDFLIQAMPSRGIRLRCSANEELMIDELKVFSAEKY